MIRIIKILTILFVITISGIIIDSCCPEGFSYKWTYIIAENIDQNYVTSSDSISKDNYGFHVQLFNQKFDPQYASNFNGFIINSAYAMVDCFESYSKVDTIINLKIITVNDLNSDRLALSDVTNLFLGSTFDPDYYEPIPELIPNINQFDWSPINDLYFTLNTDQVIDTTHQFIIEIELSDCRVLSDTTNSVRIY